MKDKLPARQRRLPCNTMMSDEWMVEFAVRSKHPAWLMLVSQKFLVVDITAVNLQPEDLIFSITEMVNAANTRDNYLANIISYYCYPCRSLAEEDHDNLPDPRPSGDWIDGGNVGDEGNEGGEGDEGNDDEHRYESSTEIEFEMVI